ncbi:MAG TPA: nitroreductase family protein [Mariprofundaceae bacterium]|nr:nitroreductase family protein [Mariprofundaceae bacterium]
MSQTRGNAATEIHELIASRWSPRAFDASRPVEREKLLACLEAARWAPSCFGDEPWRFIVCDKATDDDAWQRMLDCLTPKNRLWAQHAPVLLLSCAGSSFRANGNPNRWAQYDTGAAAVSLCLQATALGLASHQMGGFDIEKARSAFNIPDDHQPMAAMALGYQAGIETLDATFHGLELGDRQRQPLGDTFFTGRWGEPLA